jgi:DNA-binding MarR family transcriptional regulator
MFGAGMLRDLSADLHSVTVHQLSVLGLLARRHVTMRELAKDLDVSESSTTAVVDRLVRQGLVERQSDPGDRRIVRLCLSPAGAELVGRIDSATVTKCTSTLAVLSDAQLAQLIDILETLAASSDHPCPNPEPGAHR